MTNPVDIFDVYRLCRNIDGPIFDNPTEGNPYTVKLGVELELENVDNLTNIPNWVMHNDESLRNGVEYVFNGGKSGTAFVRAVDSFYKANLKFTKGPRTSTHIHINMADSKVSAVRTMYAISYMLEDGLFRTLETKRKFCGYCMPLTEQRPSKIQSILTCRETSMLTRNMAGNNAEKYYGFNINSIIKHGTVELRYFPGGPSKDELLEWCMYATNLKKAGNNFTLADLATLTTATELEMWVSAQFGTFGQKMLNTVGAESMLGFLEEIIGLLPQEEDDEERTDDLVFSTSLLANAVCKAYKLKPHQVEYFKNRVQKLGVMTREEYIRSLSKAMQLRGEAKKASNISHAASVAVEALEDGFYPELDNILNPMPAAPTPRPGRFAVRPAGRAFDPAIELAPPQETINMDELYQSAARAIQSRRIR